MKKTALFEKHTALNAKIAPFGGYQMPIQYQGILREHNATRTACAVFDTCHMGEFLIEGDTAVEDLEKVLSCDVASLGVGACRYGFLCNETGGVLDDQILYRLGPQQFMMVVNSATQEADFSWIDSHRSSKTGLNNISEQTGKIDIQGPLSAKIVNSILSESIEDLRFYRFGHNYYDGEKVLVSRTGYTGELGFELYCSNGAAMKIWDECIGRGASPAGLGARDTLRLEMGFPLYGHELSANINAGESGFSRAISSNKDFIGSAHLKNHGLQNKLVGIRLDGKRAAREGDLIEVNGRSVGFITSGSYSPSLECAIALGYVEMIHSQRHTPVSIKGKRIDTEGIVTDLPFYKQGTVRADLKSCL